MKATAETLIAIFMLKLDNGYEYKTANERTNIEREIIDIAEHYHSEQMPSIDEIREAGCINPNMPGYTNTDFENGACYVLDYIKSLSEQDKETGGEKPRCKECTDVRGQNIGNQYICDHCGRSVN